ncbi:MAG: arsinothricin resistance N-acetyltransferase ArsN1 family B [Mariniblastus sp.]
MIRLAQPTDAQRIAEIYNYYITDTVITFEEETIDAAEILVRMNKVATLGYPWIVFETEGVVVGYAYATTWRTRAAYRFTVESAVYVCHQNHGSGVGTQLYEFLIDTLKAQGIHSVIGGIALPNDKSIRLHERLGFEKVGENKEVGKKFERWIDVGWWQLMLGAK